MMGLPYPLNRVVDHGGVYRSRPDEVNLVGIRLHENTPDKVDDLLYLCTKMPDGTWSIRVFPLETEPSVDALHAPPNPAGTAIMYPEQYRNAYIVGTHRGRPALRQVGPVKVYRDNNRDSAIDLVPESVQSGNFAINIHDIRGDLAGCQGVPTSCFPLVLDACRRHVDLYGPLDYTLLKGA